MSADYPRITIITPSFNQGQYLEQTILSVIEQNYPNIEYIIIDGGSTDNSVEIIKKYQKHLSYWISEKDNGQSHAINKGLERMTGTIFNWVNSDDYLEKDALNHVAEIFLSHPEIKCCIGELKLFKNPTSFKDPKKVDVLNFERNFIEGVIKQPSTFYSSEIITRIGKLNEHLHFCMDLDFWYKFILNYKMTNIYLHNKILANFRIQDNSKSVSMSDQFYNDKATLFYSMLIAKNENILSSFLKHKFAIIKKYSFEASTDELQLGLIIRAAAYFLLDSFGKIYTRHDFKNAIEVKYVLRSLSCSFDLVDKKKYFSLCKNTFWNSWFLFRARRKYYHFFK